MTEKTSKLTPDADSLAKSASALNKKGPAPVHLWNPPFCGNLDIRIARDGTWYYLGTPIGRKRLVKLFSTILRKDDDDYFLVTPVEKVGIQVDDAPFVAVDFEVHGSGKNQEILFKTNVDEEAIAGPKNKIRVIHDPNTDEPSPYVRIRSNLDALIDRKSFYRLVDIAENYSIKGEQWFGVWSSNEFFPIILSSELDIN